MSREFNILFFDQRCEMLDLIDDLKAEGLEYTVSDPNMFGRVKVEWEE